MNRVGIASLSVLASLAATALAAAQAGEPPPPPPPPVPANAPSTNPPAAAPVPGTAPAPANAAEVPGPAGARAPATAASGNGNARAGASASIDSGLDTWGSADGEGDGGGEARESGAEPAVDEMPPHWRLGSLQQLTGITGSTGLLRVTQAGSGAPGTFRVSLLTSFFSGSGVLCNGDSRCPSVNGELPTSADELDAMTAHLGLSATILPFLEAYIGFHNRATSDSRSRPQLLQVLGDTNLGVKGFMPAARDRLFFFGGEAELWLLNGTGGVGLDGGGTSFALRALATIDPNNRVNPEARVPIRVHTNFGLKIDRSANLVDKLENTEPPRGRGERITRIERFGLGINRVNFFQFGIGGEYVHPVIRPFAEWTLDVPVNMAGYECNIDQAEAHGEDCLKFKEGLGIAPSRLTLGARLFPWEGRGLGITAAFDIGTSGTSTFIDETAPELPWNLWLGLAYAVDTEPPKPTIQKVQVPAPRETAATEFFIQGSVLEKGTQTPVPNALVRFDGRPLTGLIANESGIFRSSKLSPGTYTFKITAQGYREGQCSATITGHERRGQAPGSPGAALPPQPTLPGAPPTAAGDIVIPIQCELESLPKLGSIAGTLTDAETNAPVGGARVKAADRKNREIELSASANGAFSITNIPPGRVKLTVDAPGYFTTTTELDVKALDELQTRLVLNKRPAQPNVVVQGKEVKLRKQVHFGTDSADILPDSMALLEEIADVLKSHPEINSIEVQGHTDNTGTPPHNLRLSQERSQAVVDALVKLGIDPMRLTAKGYGQEKPLVPNINEPNRARNRRVQLIILTK